MALEVKDVPSETSTVLGKPLPTADIFEAGPTTESKRNRNERQAYISSMSFE